MTRLADITHLDSLGIPVIQAVRPWTRGLSVHQGKGFTVAQAALGAAMEAIEQHQAERFTGDPMVRPFAELPVGERAASVRDFAADGAAAPSPDEPLAWVEAWTLGGHRLWAPFDVVSLDFAHRGDPRLARSSDGLASRFDLSDAFATGLLELVERDAVARFLKRGPVARLASRVDLDSAAFGWLTLLRERLRAARVEIAVHHAPCAVATTFVCELLEPAARPAFRACVWGSGCHPRPEVALEKAVLEAVQSRLTAISGARDDFLLTPEQSRTGSVGFSLPPPASRPGLAWSTLAGAHEPWAPTASAVASRLASAGYPRCAFVDLSPLGGEVAVVKALVPGLGAGAGSRASIGVVAA